MSYAQKIKELVAERNAVTATMLSALRLLADIRWALGDKGVRMQPELVEYARQLLKDAERYRWLRDDPPLTLSARRFPGETEAGCYLDGHTLDAAVDAAILAATAAGAA